MSLKAAMTTTLAGMEAGDGGFIGVDASGDYSMQFNTGGMFRGVTRSRPNSEPETQVFIW